MLGRALIDAVIDSDEMQLIKIDGLDNEVQEGLERPQNYGMTAYPPQGGEALVGYIQGNREDGIVIIAGHAESRPKDLNEGEVCIYAKFGQTICLGEDGNVTFFEGTDFAVKYTALAAAYSELQNVFNLHEHPLNIAELIAEQTPTKSTGDITLSKVDKVRLP